MKKNLIFSLVAGILLTGLLSFTIIKVNHNKAIPAAAKKTAAAKAKKFSCACTIATLSNTGGGSFSWTTNGQTYDHFNYGGYYQAGGTFSGSTYSTSTSIPTKTGGGRFNVTPICADGTSGTPMNILF